jgi:hypothetical protein
MKKVVTILFGLLLAGCGTVNTVDLLTALDSIQWQSDPPPPLTPADEPPPAQMHDLMLRVVRLTADKVWFEWDPRNYGWPSTTVKVEVDAVVEMYRADGRGGKFDWIRKGGQGVKGLENVHNGYGCWKVVGLPAPGETVRFRWVSVDGKRRSNDAEAIWPR